jgi:hypothetical protein
MDHGAHGGGMGSSAQGASSPTFGVHNQMMVGQQTVYLSHLPMFMFDPRRHEHNFQVILEVTLAGQAQQTYSADRQKHPDVRMYTMSPKPFDMLELDPARPTRTTLQGDIFRGHLERGGDTIIPAATARVEQIVYFHAFDPRARLLDQLEYILFGKDTELFLAHVITRPPDFDQLVGVQIGGAGLPAESLRRGVRIQVPERENAAHARLKAGERVMARAEGAGQPFELTAVTEFYFEEGELQMMTMDQTPEEKKAGF